jgi:hypothetical protein
MVVVTCTAFMAMAERFGLWEIRLASLIRTCGPSKNKDFMVFLYLHLNGKDHNILEKSRDRLLSICFKRERILLLLIRDQDLLQLEINWRISCCEILTVNKI